jgi:DNA end-binding protein Ku
MYRRERAVMLVPRGKGIMLWTLRYGDEVRDEADYFGDLADTKADGEALKLVTRLIKSRTSDWDPKLVQDPVQDGLREMIESRKKGRKKPAKAKDRRAAGERQGRQHHRRPEAQHRGEGKPRKG